MECPKCGNKVYKFGKIENYCLKCDICALHPEAKPEKRKITIGSRKKHGRIHPYSTLVCVECEE